MSNLAELFLESASAVAALGAGRHGVGEHGDVAAAIAALDDAGLRAGMARVRDHRRNLQAYETLLAAEIARRSDHTLGYDGLARRNGFATPAAFIQSLTGTSIDEATKLARLGSMMLDAEASGGAAIAAAATSGGISLDAADAIRRGLGVPDDAVTAEQIRDAADELIGYATAATTGAGTAGTAAIGPGAMGLVTPEALLKLARQARARLDLAAVERGEKRRASMRYVRTWQRDGLSGGSWCLPDEDGGADLHTALRLLLAATTGGPRFVDAGGDAPTAPPTKVLDDTRTAEQILADGFGQIMANSLRVDPSVVPGAGRAPVRVLVTEQVLTERSGSALLEETLSAITFAKLQEYLCEGGAIEVVTDRDGNLLDVGREQRLYTKRQRTGLGVRDGGCRYPGCAHPPSWCEAHHIDEWHRDHGETTVANGILLCRYHHMLIHNTDAEIIPADGTFWLKPSRDIDPAQTLIEMPSRNPLITAMRRARRAATAEGVEKTEMETAS